MCSKVWPIGLLVYDWSPQHLRASNSIIHRRKPLKYMDKYADSADSAVDVNNTKQREKWIYTFYAMNCKYFQFIKRVFFTKVGHDKG